MTEQNMSGDQRMYGAKRKSGKNRGRRGILLLLAVLIAGGAAAGGYLLWKNKSKSASSEVTYREETVQNGPLTVGFDEDGTIAVGTSEQDFDLDLSAYTGTTSTSSSSSGGMGGGMMGGMPGQSSNNNSNSSSGSSSGTRELTVQKILVAEGQEIKEGDAVATIDSDSVDSIRSDLTEDVSNAQLTLNEAKTTQSTTDQTAENNLKTWKTYGTYAQTEFDAAVSDLQDAVDTAQDQLSDDQTSLSDLQTDLSDDQTKLASYKKLLSDAEYSKSSYDETDTSQLYEYLKAENQREDAQTLVDDTEDDIDDLNDQITTMTATIASDQRTLDTALKALESGNAESKATYDTKTLYYGSADSYYSAATKQAALNVEIAQSDYDDAVDKLNKFNSAIADNSIVAAYSGIVESVSLSEGDALGTGTEILTVNDYDDVTIDVDVASDDMDSVAEGDSVKIAIDAYPDQDFTGKVESIGDSTYNSSTGETTYAVTVLLDNADSTFYNGMSATVTFVTKETKTVLYIPNRAIMRENGTSYVYVKDEDGKQKKVEVTTGFSDGTDTEVKEGLSEGETVLIESKVSGS
jgi:HlyD family secretion protein